WATVFWSALGGLVALGAGLAITALIEDLYARATWLGTFGAALAALAVLSLLVICIREAIGLSRLASIEKLRARAELALAEADRLVARTATRVSLVTAVSPRAAIDLAFVLFAALGMIRRLAALYGGRPGFLGIIRLVRHIVAHLTVTGTLAAGDSLIQQMLGHGVAAKPSARLGEGVLNGLLTARLGPAAVDV